MPSDDDKCAKMAHDEVATGFHLKEYTIVELALLLRSAGFSNVDIFLSYHGYHLSPRLPIVPFVWVENLLMRFPRKVSRRIATLLTAVKVVGKK